MFQQLSLLRSQIVSLLRMPSLNYIVISVIENARIGIDIFDAKDEKNKYVHIYEYYLSYYIIYRIATQLRVS